jgi:hypothetical protein
MSDGPTTMMMGAERLSDPNLLEEEGCGDVHADTRHEKWQQHESQDQSGILSSQIEIAVTIANTGLARATLTGASMLVTMAPVSNGSRHISRYPRSCCERIVEHVERARDLVCR